MRRVYVKITNWEKHNPKRDQKTYTWLRLNNDIMTDPKLYGLSSVQRLAWIALLCEVSKVNTGFIEFDVEWLADLVKAKIEDISTLLVFLDQSEIISISESAVAQVKVHDRARSHTEECTTPTYERTNVRKNILSLAEKSAIDQKKPISPNDADELVEIIGKSFLAELLEIYPDQQWIEQEIRKIVLWYRDNPRKAFKTPRGHRRLISGWLGRGWDTHVLKSPTKAVMNV